MARKTVNVTISYPSGVDWATAWEAVKERVNGPSDGLMLSATPGSYALSAGDGYDGGEPSEARRAELLKGSALGQLVLADRR